MENCLQIQKFTDACIENTNKLSASTYLNRGSDVSPEGIVENRYNRSEIVNLKK